nr:PREDICTED: acid sphingomyelinase-like phosphodiesterase 3b [Bemisia tabaci]
MVSPRVFNLVVFSLSCVLADSSTKIGYFWHISDIHLDEDLGTNFNNCWRGPQRPSGKYGDHNCDSSRNLVESAVHAMRQKHGDNVEFVLWTGDGLSRKSGKTLEQQIGTLRNLTILLSAAFSSHFIYPVLGHEDPESYTILANLWKLWLPTEALLTFTKGGYYSIEQKVRKLRIVALNTNLFTNSSWDQEAEEQWDWLESVLIKSSRNKETVYLVGHVPPGMDERQSRSPHQQRILLMPSHNSRYLALVRRFANIITGQFFGHFHTDSFRIVYDDNDNRPVSTIFIAPSVTPKRSPNGVNNPGLRLYKFNKDTGQVLDYNQYYLDLSVANKDEKAEWTSEYNLTSYYEFKQSTFEPVSAEQMDQLAESFIVPADYDLFYKYYVANSVKALQNDAVIPHSTINAHYCAITQIDFSMYHNCLATKYSALASSKSSKNQFRNWIGQLIFTLILVSISS